MNVFCVATILLTHPSPEGLNVCRKNMLTQTLRVLKKQIKTGKTRKKQFVFIGFVGFPLFS